MLHHLCWIKEEEIIYINKDRCGNVQFRGVQYLEQHSQLAARQHGEQVGEVRVAGGGDTHLALHKHPTMCFNNNKYALLTLKM